ncbi:VOC family protein [Thermodesulfobacteriota bacterium]
MTEKLYRPKVDQIGVIVKDLKKSVEHYTSLGIGPFETLTGIESRERMMWGKPIAVDAFKVDIRVAKMGDVDLELIEPIEGESIWKDFLETKGEGINHLGFFVDDIEKEEAAMVESGFPAIYRTRFKKGGGAAYFDTDQVGGVLFEFIEWPPT